MKFSIIATGYNAASFAIDCVASCLKQDYDPEEFEIIVVDDASTDNTWDILTTAFAATRGVKLIRNEINMGAAFGRWNAGKIASGEIQCFLGLDDMLKPNALKVLEKYYSDPVVRMTYGSWCYENGTPRIAESYPNQVMAEKSFRRNKWRATALQTFKSELLDLVPIEVLKDEGGRWLKNCTDLAIGFPCLELCDIHEVRVVTEVIYIYRHDHAGTTLNRLGKAHKTKVREYLKTIKKQKEGNGRKF